MYLPPYKINEEFIGYTMYVVCVAKLHDMSTQNTDNNNDISFSQVQNYAVKDVLSILSHMCVM